MSYDNCLCKSAGARVCEELFVRWEIRRSRPSNRINLRWSLSINFFKSASSAKLIFRERHSHVPKEKLCREEGRINLKWELWFFCLEVYREKLQQPVETAFFFSFYFIFFNIFVEEAMEMRDSQLFGNNAQTQYRTSLSWIGEVTCM